MASKRKQAAPSAHAAATAEGPADPPPPTVDDVQSDSEQTDDSNVRRTASMTSNEVNCVLYNYLQETGLTHTAFSLLHESGLNRARTATGSRVMDISISPNHLVRILHKGLLYLEAEARWRGDESSSIPPTLLGVDIHDTGPLPKLIRSRNRSTSPQPSAAVTPGPSNARQKARSASNPPPPSLSQSVKASSKSQQSTISEQVEEERDQTDQMELDSEPRRRPDTLALPSTSKAKPKGAASSDGSRSAQHSAPVSRETSPPSSMRPPSRAAHANSGSAAATSKNATRQPTKSPETTLLPLPSVGNKRKERENDQISLPLRRINGVVDGESRNRKPSPVAISQGSAHNEADNPSIAQDKPSQSSSATPMDLDPKQSIKTTTTTSKQTTVSENGTTERDSKRVKLEILSDVSKPETPKAMPAKAANTPLSSMFTNSNHTAGKPDRPPAMPMVTVRTVTAPVRPPPVHSASTSYVHVNGTHNASNSKDALAAHRRSSSPLVNRRDTGAATTAPSASSSGPMSRSLSAGGGSSQKDKTSGTNANSKHRSSSPESSRLPATKKPNAPRTNSSNSAAQIHVPSSKKANQTSASAGDTRAETSSLSPLKNEGKPPLLGQISDSNTLQLIGHAQSSQPVQWCPKNPNMLVTGSADGTARVWEVPVPPRGRIDVSVSCKHQQGSKKSDVLVVSWNNDGTLFGTGSDDGVVRVWTAAGDLYLVLSMHQKGIMSIKWHKTGTMMLTASLDGTVCCWELGSGRAKQQFETHTDAVMDADWFDATTFASCSKDRNIHICSLSRNTPLHRLRGHTDEVNFCRFDVSKSILATCSDDHTARLWSMAGYLKPSNEAATHRPLIDQKGGVFVLSGHTEAVNSISWQPQTSSDGPRILGTSSFDCTARLWDADQGVCLHTLNRHSEIVYSLCFSPTDGAYVALGSDDKRVTVFRVKDGELLVEHTLPGPVYESLWHPNKNQIAVTGRFPDVRVINLPDLNRPVS